MFSKYNQYLEIHMKHLKEAFGHVSREFPEAVIKGFTLSHDLRSLSHDGAAMRQLAPCYIAIMF